MLGIAVLSAAVGLFFHVARGIPWMPNGEIGSVPFYLTPLLGIGLPLLTVGGATLCSWLKAWMGRPGIRTTEPEPSIVEVPATNHVDPSPRPGVPNGQRLVHDIPYLSEVMQRLEFEFFFRSAL